jgi:hypothetical protein
MSNDNIILIERYARGIKIWVSVENLCDLAERHPDNPVKIVDKDKFIEEYIHQLQEYQQSNDVENGCSHLEWFIEECIQQVYENGSETVQAINDEE